jgi:hypothetical protein
VNGKNWAKHPHESQQKMVTSLQQWSSTCGTRTPKGYEMTYQGGTRKTTYINQQETQELLEA